MLSEPGEHVDVNFTWNAGMWRHPSGRRRRLEEAASFQQLSDFSRAQTMLQLGTPVIVLRILKKSNE
jgi:hypothetical protein